MNAVRITPRSDHYSIAKISFYTFVGSLVLVYFFLFFFPNKKAFSFALLNIFYFHWKNFLQEYELIIKLKDKSRRLFFSTEERIMIACPQ